MFSRNIWLSNAGQSVGMDPSPQKDGAQNDQTVQLSGSLTGHHGLTFIIFDLSSCFSKFAKIESAEQKIVYVKGKIHEAEKMDV